MSFHQFNRRFDFSSEQIAANKINTANSKSILTRWNPRLSLINGFLRKKAANSNHLFEIHWVFFSSCIQQGSRITAILFSLSEKKSPQILSLRLRKVIRTQKNFIVESQDFPSVLIIIFDTKIQKPSPQANFKFFPFLS